MRPCFLLSISGSGTISCMRYLESLGYQIDPFSTLNLGQGSYSQLHVNPYESRQNLAEVGLVGSYTHVPTIVPVRHPLANFLTLTARAYDTEEIAGYWIELYRQLVNFPEHRVIALSEKIDPAAAISDFLEAPEGEMGTYNETLEHKKKIARRLLREGPWLSEALEIYDQLLT